MAQLRRKNWPALQASFSGQLRAINHWTLRPALRPDPKKNPTYDEIWFVINGAVDFTLGKDTFHLIGGDYISIPRGTLYTYSANVLKTETLCFKFDDEEQSSEKITLEYFRYDNNGDVVTWHPGRDFVPLEEYDDEVIAKYVAKRATYDPQFASLLKSAYDEVAVPSVALPAVAPCLWADREPGTNPPTFIRTTYAPWIDAGVMTRSALRDCDKALYNAYAQWIHRKPEDAITFASSGNKPGPKPEPNAEKAIARVRENWRSSRQRARVKASLVSDGPT